MEIALFGDEPLVFAAFTDRERISVAAHLAGVPLIVFLSKTMELIDHDGNSRIIAVLPSPPTCPYIIAAATPEGYRELQPLVEWCGSVPAEPFAPILQIGNESSESAAVQLLRRLLDQARAAHTSTALDLVRRCEEALALRKEIERLNGILSSYRESVSSTAFTARVICEPGTRVWGPDGDGIREFRFPFATWGLSRIDLHFRSAQPGAAGAVEIECEGMEDDSPLGLWKLSYSDVESGWRSLLFPVTLSARNYYVRLVLRWHTEAGGPPLICLSGAQLEMEGQSRFDAPLTDSPVPAIRLWSGLPGILQSSPSWVDRAAIDV